MLVEFNVNVEGCECRVGQESTEYIDLFIVFHLKIWFLKIFIEISHQAYK